MSFIDPVVNLGQKLWQLSSRVDINAANIAENTNDVKTLQKQIRRLVNYIKKLEEELEKEREKHKHLQEMHELELKRSQERHEFELEKYRLENQNFKTELELKLEQFKTALFKEDRSRDRFEGNGTNILKSGENPAKNSAT